MTTTLPAVSHYLQARKAAAIISHILVDEMKLQYPEKFLITEHGQFVWLFAVMDDLHLGGPMNKYLHESTIHRLSTSLDGLPVYLSNHSGLRYAVLLSEKPRLPNLVPFPDEALEHDVMHFGVGLSGPVQAAAKQIVNMIIVGAQDSGKSMALRALAHSARLHGSLLCLADPIAHTFNPDYWERATVLPIARNKGDFLTMLQALGGEIEKRSVAFRAAAKEGIQPEDLDQYNEMTGEAMPRVWLIADEVNSLLNAKSVQEALGEPARSGRKYGIHIVLAGHDWHEYTVPRELTSYFETRLCLRTSNDTAGRIVLDDNRRGKRTMQFHHPGRGLLRLRGQYQELQLYKVAPDRERSWFIEIRNGTSVKWNEPSGTKGQTEAVDPDAARIRDLLLQGDTDAAIVRKVWNVYGGGSYYKLIDRVKALRGEKTSSSSVSSTPSGGVLGLNGTV